MLPRVNLVRTDTGEYLAFGQDFISQELFSKGQWEAPLPGITSIFLNGISRPLVLDIGANLGAYTVPVAKQVAAAGGSVIAIEAQRMVYYQLCGNVFLNRLDNVTVLHHAVGGERGVIDLPRPNYAVFGNVGAFAVEESLRIRNGTQAAMTAETEKVTMLPLDELDVPRAPGFIKIDVEGYELNVLKGARQFLKRHNYPPFFFEVWSEEWFAKDKQELLSFVQALGYEVTPLMGYDHIAQHPANAVQVKIDRTGAAFNLTRVR